MSIWITGLTWRQFKDTVTVEQDENLVVGGIDKVSLENKIRKLFILADTYNFSDFWDTFDEMTVDADYQCFNKGYLDDDVNRFIKSEIQNLFNAYKMFQDILNENLGTIHDLNKQGSTTNTGTTSSNLWSENTHYAEDDNDKKRLQLYDSLKQEFTYFIKRLSERYLSIFVNWKGDYWRHEGDN